MTDKKNETGFGKIAIAICLMIGMVYLYFDGEKEMKDSFQNKTFQSTTVFFDVGSTIVKDSSFSILVDSASYFILRGHTDSSGNEQKNAALSMLRAYQVASILREKAIDLEIKIDPCSSSKPLSDNSTEQGRKLNRRVEILWARK